MTIQQAIDYDEIACCTEISDYIVLMSSKQEAKLEIEKVKLDMQAVMDTVKIPIWTNAKGSDLFGRTHDFNTYQQKVIKSDIWMFGRCIQTGVDTKVQARDASNKEYYGVNFASVDYLGLAQDPRAKQAAIDAAHEFGLSSGGTPSGMGAHRLYQQLEKELSAFWDSNVMIYPTGWMSAFGVVKGLITKSDFVIMDKLSHICLQEGAQAATKNVIRFRHLDQKKMTETLIQTRRKNPDSAILVITEGLFSMDADSPDINYYQKVTKEHGAFLLLDCAHDFGHLGQWGRGACEVQKVKDMSNVLVCGTGSKCLSTNIGFVGCKDAKVIEHLRHTYDYSHSVTINPAQAATSLAQLRILSSIEGVERRRKVTENYNYLYKLLKKNGREIIGSPCAIMIVMTGSDPVTAILARVMMQLGFYIFPVYYPAVEKNKARLRIGLMPQHTKEDLELFAETLEKGLELAEQIFARGLEQFMKEKEEEEQAKL